MKKNLKETLEENKYSIELSLINFLLFIFKISDYIDDKRKKILGNKILKEFNFDDYFALGLLLDEIDFKNFEENDKVEKIKKILFKYKDVIIKKIEDLKIESDFKTFDNLLTKLKRNLRAITESKNRDKTELEISKIYKPKIDTSKLGKQGPFKKDTKNAQLKKDPYSRKYSKNKKGYLNEKAKFNLNIEKEDLLFNKDDNITDEKREEIIGNLNFFYKNMTSFPVDYLEKVKNIFKKINNKLKHIFKSDKEIM